MSFREPVPVENKWRERRRGVRMNSSVEVDIAWRDSAGQERELVAVTRMVSPHGCLVVLPEDLPLRQMLLLTNRARAQKSGAAVVWKGRQRVEGFELGIELQNPENDFWGLDL